MIVTIIIIAIVYIFTVPILFGPIKSEINIKYNPYDDGTAWLATIFWPIAIPILVWIWLAQSNNLEGPSYYIDQHKKRKKLKKERKEIEAREREIRVAQKEKDLGITHD